MTNTDWQDSQPDIMRLERIAVALEGILAEYKNQMYQVVRHEVEMQVSRIVSQQLSTLTRYRMAEEALEREQERIKKRAIKKRNRGKKLKHDKVGRRQI